MARIVIDCYDESGFPVAGYEEAEMVNEMTYQEVLTQACRNTRNVAWGTSKAWGFGPIMINDMEAIRQEYSKLIIEKRMSEIAKQVSTATGRLSDGVSTTKTGRDATGRFTGRKVSTKHPQKIGL